MYKKKNRLETVGIRRLTAIFLVIGIMISVSGILTGCGTVKQEDGKITVVTTLFPQYDFVRQIAGDKVNVKLLLQPGIEAHSYDPSPSDLVAINESDLFIYTGKYMETWAADMISSLERDVTVLDLSKDIKLVEEEHGMEEEADNSSGESGGHEHIYDPHIWTSLENACIMVSNIAETLSELDPENKKYYLENSDKYIGELRLLESQFQEIVENADYKTIYFGGKFAMYYFTEELGLDYISAFDSCTSETEPSARLVAKIVDAVKENRAPVVYYEELSNHKAADAICSETGAEALLLHSCHNISKAEYQAGVTYLSLMKQNRDNLMEGLFSEEKQEYWRKLYHDK
ncbi:MAG: zinc ABC transporter substrate-binding protein [Lachnospiraceae bacterium]|nr:zinc ABC transporter substrate-binding protein [Lachnospiraceae bacterium]